ncbi:MAG: c-type cytochrome [Rhodocyclaceae bacterium]|nr:c-type cytochrome [Rhodocyclaceae bacterium]
MKLNHFLLLGVTLVGSLTAHAADPAAGLAIATTICAACHNPDGNSILPANPKLAGQHAAYLLKQMKNFKGVGDKPAERASPIMNGMIMTVDEKQMADLAAYFASQKQTNEQVQNKETLALGRKLFISGDATQRLPACAGCHGPTGAGIPSQYPRIAGQFSEYLEGQLKAFRSGERANDPNKMMRMIAHRMTDAEIKAVSDYIAGMK